MELTQDTGADKLIAEQPIMEDGSRGELMKPDGIYARLYRAQAEWYVWQTGNSSDNMNTDSMGNRSVSIR